MAKLGVRDAAFHFLRDEAGSVDMYGIYVFDSGDSPAPTFDEIRAHVAERAPMIPALNVVLEEVAFGLDYPSWVPARSDTDAHLTDHDLADASWENCQRLLSTFLETGLDSRVRPWHVHVVRGVQGVPLVAGEATVVVLQVTHAMTDGMGLTHLANALFAPASTPKEIVGALLTGHVPAARPRWRSLRAIASVAAVPIKLVRFVSANRTARRRYAERRARIPSSYQPGAPTRLTADPTERRAVHIVPVQSSVFRDLGVPITSAALSVVAEATTRYLLAHGDPVPPVLNAGVPIALGAHAQWPSANRVLSGVVDLHAHEPDPMVRAHEISTGLKAERARVTSPESIALARAEEHLPAPVVLLNRRLQNRRVRPASTAVLSHTSVVSVDRGASPLELCGSRVTFTSGTPMLTSGRSVVHGFFGVGDVVTVVVLACPDTVPDHEFYRDLLVSAINDTVAAVPRRTEGNGVRGSKA